MLILSSINSNDFYLLDTEDCISERITEHKVDIIKRLGIRVYKEDVLREIIEFFKGVCSLEEYLGSGSTFEMVMKAVFDYNDTSSIKDEFTGSDIDYIMNIIRDYEVLKGKDIRFKSGVFFKSDSLYNYIHLLYNLSWCRGSKEYIDLLYEISNKFGIPQNLLRV